MKIRDDGPVSERATLRSDFAARATRKSWDCGSNGPRGVARGVARRDWTYCSSTHSHDSGPSRHDLPDLLAADSQPHSDELGASKAGLPGNCLIVAELCGSGFLCRTGWRPSQQTAVVQLHQVLACASLTGKALLYSAEEKFLCVAVWIQMHRYHFFALCSR